MTTWVEARSAKQERQRREQRYYTPDRLGPLCVDGCGQRMPIALVDRGIHGHPTCGPEFRALTATKAGVRHG